MDASTLKLAKNFTFKGENVVVVGKNGHYEKLSEALAAITDADLNKQYHILVYGDIAETEGIVAKSNIHVTGVGNASVTVTMTDATNGFTFNDIVNTVWKNIDLLRAGEVTLSHAYGAYIRGTCDRTVIFRNVRFKNITTSASKDHRIGAMIADTADPLFENCTFAGASGFNYGIGLFITGRSKGLYRDCLGIGGSGYGNCYGIYVKETATPMLINCTGIGGQGGASCFGIHIKESGMPTLINCTFIGGNGGDTCYGLFVLDSARPIVSNCTIFGGSGGTACYGIYLSGAASINGKDIVVLPPSMATYDDLTETGTIILSSTLPHQIRNVSVQVVTAAAGQTISIGTTEGGNDIANAIAIDTTGYKAVPLGAGALKVITANTPLYVTFSGGGRVIIRTSIVICNTNCYGICISTSGRVLLNNCSFTSNPASMCMCITNAAVSANNLLITNCHIEALPKDSSSMRALWAESEYSDAPIYNCVLSGGVTRVTAKAAGSTNGTNMIV